MLFAIGVQAQVGELRHNFAVGVNGGMNFNTVSFSPSMRQHDKQGIHAGLTLRYISEKYFAMICGVQIEVNYSQHGWSEFYEDYPTLKYERTMNYVEMPFLAHLAFGKKFQFFFNLGPQVGFFVGESSKLGGDWSDITTPQQHDMKVENKFDYGITGGAGVEWRTGIGNFLLEGRYYYALSDFFNSTKKDYFARSAHTAIVAKVTYLFDLTK
jgi:hypothetical protein